jgi:putative ABC transport system permease protein
VGPILESIWIALHSIWTNKLRSFLTVLGNIVAVTSIVTVVSLIQGLNSTVSGAIVGRVGADTFVVQRTPIVRTEADEERVRSFPLITRQEAEVMRQYSPLIQAVLAQAQNRGTVSYRTRELQSVQVQGVSSDFAEFSNFDAERGRLMTVTEVDRSQNVALLGYDVADQLFGDINPLDKTITISGSPFRVVGVSSRKGSIFGNSQDSFIVIPLGAYARIFGSRQSLSLLVKPTSPEDIQPAIDDARVALRVARRLKPGDEDTFGIFTSDTVLGIYQQATSGIFAVLVGVVALSLLVGGIVIMNIMLMAVSERTREIGLRKALGAKRRDIMSQFLTESVTLSSFGGVVGIVLGFVAAQVIAYFSPLPATLELWSVALGVGITAVVGLFFGAYPAARAARLDPIEALRRE